MPNAAFLSINIRDHWIRHKNFVGVLGWTGEINTMADNDDFWFEIVPGLANPADESLISFRATNANLRSHYLRHQGYEIKLMPRPSVPSQDPLFDADATFIQRPGLADVSKSSFVAAKLGGQDRHDRFIRHRNFKLFIEPRGADVNLEKDATFEVRAKVT